MTPTADDRESVGWLVYAAAVLATPTAVRVAGLAFAARVTGPPTAFLPLPAAWLTGCALVNRRAGRRLFGVTAAAVAGTLFVNLLALSAVLNDQYLDPRPGPGGSLVRLDGWLRAEWPVAATVVVLTAVGRWKRSVGDAD